MQDKKYSKKNRVNGAIQSSHVRLVTEEGSTVITIEEALNKAQMSNMDLVEISQNEDIPVCKIFDYEKHSYKLQRQPNEGKKRQKFKELKFRVNIDENDYKVKLNQVYSFIQKGNKVRLYLKFIGREALHTDVGMNIFNRLIEDTEHVAKIESNPKKEHNQLIMALSPKR